MRDLVSPNFDERPADTRVDMVILHYTGMVSATAALERLRDPQAAVSCHYLIDEDGSTIRMVDERYRAWHAGISGWLGRTSLNDCSIGIELVNPGHEWGYRPFPEPQMGNLIGLLRDIVGRHGIPPQRVVGHSDVAPSRKTDPGELFDWRRLAGEDLALWPEHVSQREPDEGVARQLLEKIGYSFELPDTNVDVITEAFQRRFRPDRIDGHIDPQTMGLIHAVLAETQQPMDDGSGVGRPGDRS